METRKTILIAVLNGRLNWVQDVKLRRLIYKSISTLLAKYPKESPVEFELIDILYMRKYTSHLDRIYCKIISDVLPQEIEIPIMQEISNIFKKNVVVVPKDF